MNTTTVVVALALAVSIVVVVFQLRRSSAQSQSMSATLQNLTQAVNQNQTQTAVLAEKVSQLEPVTQRISSTLSGDLSKVKEDLSSLQAYAKARQEVEQRTSESIKRLESVIAGTRSKGTAGENVVELVFAQLPVEWQVRNFTVNGKSVEFGLKLPSNLILPIDSKWAATDLIDELASTEDVSQQQRVQAEIQKATLQKAREVSKYIDPAVTMPFGIAVIPDAAYQLCTRILGEAFQMNVVLVSYSNLVPYLFLIIQTAVKTLHSVDLQRLDAYLDSVLNSINALQGELEGRFSKALTMLANSRDEMRSHISKAAGSITSLQISTPLADAPASLPPPDGS